MYNVEELENQTFTKYWFVPTQLQRPAYTVQDGVIYNVYENGKLVGPYLDNNMPGDMDTDFRVYQSRPEYLLGHDFDIPTNAEQAITLYEKLIVGTILVKRYVTHFDFVNIRFLKSVLDWLRSTDFYTAPGSTVYHDSSVSGLLFHTLRVLKNSYELLKINKFNDVNIVDITCVALCHDWCKIGLYTPYKRNVKNEETGQWEQVDSFRRNDPAIPLGHGVESLYKAMKVFRLSEEEAAAIRWHMGAWNVATNETNDLQTANERFPLVHLLQFADQLSIVNY